LVVKNKITKFVGFLSELSCEISLLIDAVSLPYMPSSITLSCSPAIHSLCACAIGSSFITCVTKVAMHALAGLSHTQDTRPWTLFILVCAHRACAMRISANPGCEGRPCVSNMTRDPWNCQSGGRDCVGKNRAPSRPPPAAAVQILCL